MRMETIRVSLPIGFLAQVLLICCRGRGTASLERAYICTIFCTTVPDSGFSMQVIHTAAPHGDLAEENTQVKVFQHAVA